MPQPIVKRASVVVPAPLDEVYRFTQDFARRHTWDPAVRSATVISEGPPRQVRVNLAGGDQVTFVYRAERSDNDNQQRTNGVTMTDIRSRWIAAGGGAWTYESLGASTRWTIVTSVTLRSGLLTRLLRPMIVWSVSRALRQGMARVVAHFERHRSS